MLVSRLKYRMFWSRAPRSRGNHFASEANSSGGPYSYVTNILIYSAKYLAGVAREQPRDALFESEISPAQAK